MRFPSFRLCLLCFLLPLLSALSLRAKPVNFDLPSQPIANALLAFSKQAGIEVLFSFEELNKIQSTAVTGEYEPEAALIHLLGNRGFTVKRDSKGKLVVTAIAPRSGTLQGRLMAPPGTDFSSIRVTILETRQFTKPDENGYFKIDGVTQGNYRVTATGNGFQRAQAEHVSIQAGKTSSLENLTLQKREDLTRLDPYVVQGKAEPPRPFARSREALPPRNAVGNLDLPRTENDALPYQIFDREQIMRSGVVGLNEFLVRSVLESGSSTLSEQANQQNESISGGSTLKLRGFNDDQTVILLDGRRLPEVLTSESRTLGPDVNFIPLSLIQQVEVLPVSASALYSGNAVGGVINIVLRPNVEATEVNATYTNSVSGFDAPQSTVSLLHGQSLLGGKLHLRVNASFTHSTPPAESELGYHQGRLQANIANDQPIFRATPNVRSADNSPLALLGNSSVTSVAPGADGLNGLAAFAHRGGVRNFDLYDGPGGLSASTDSRDYAFGRQQTRSAYFGSAVYDVLPWLQIGLDGSYVRTTVNRGYDLFGADLSLAATSPFNPFGQNVKVSLNEATPLLGAKYSEAHLELYTFVFGVQLKLPADWQVSFDTQYARNLTKYRGLTQPDTDQWQQLVDAGIYNPLRDTQISGPPTAFYDHTLVYYGGRGKFVTLGDYDTIDAAWRVTNRKLTLPTGATTINFGADYRRSHINPYIQEFRFGDGSLAEDPILWTGRTLQRYSGFGEIQTPLVPEKWLPRWLHKVETDLAVRYVAADSAAEANVAPTLALKVDLPGNVSIRGSLTTSSRFPTPQMSRPLGTTGGTGGIGSDTQSDIIDPRRGGESYHVISQELTDTGLSSEDSVTQTAGVVWQHGKTHRLRVAVDFVDTRKVNEIVAVTGAQDVIDLESYFPEHVIRAAPATGDPYPVGKATTLLTGIFNLSSRHSQNWNTSIDYVCTESAGGTFEAYARWLYFQTYHRTLVAGAPVTDELENPDSTASSLLRQRVNFGAGWSKPYFGFGVDGHYFSPRILPVADWVGQGSNQIKEYWQFDVYLQGDLMRWLPCKSSKYGLRGQLRVNNISGFDYPKYVKEGSGSGVQPYGDWRGRTYSVSITATF